MKIKRIKAIAAKEFIHIKRDRRSLILSFLIPIVLLVLFGYALSLDVKDIPTTVLDYDRSSYSRELIENFSQSGYFSINDYVTGYDQVRDNINSYKSEVAIIIPQDFGDDLISGKKVQIQTIIDGSQSNKASIALGYIEGIAQSFSSKMLVETKDLRDLEMPLNTEVRIWYNPRLESKNYIIPGIIAIIMLIIASLLTSLVISREWENGTMEQLIVSPVKSYELILGKVIPYFIIGMLDLAMIVILGKFIFGIPINGSIVLLFFLSSIFMVGALGLGITISIVTKSQVLSYQMAMLTSFLPSYILSGLVFPISSMPRAVQYISYLVPARYYIIILRGIFLKGSGFVILGIEVLYLAIFGIVMFIMANLRFVKKLN